MQTEGVSVYIDELDTGAGNLLIRDGEAHFKHVCREL